MLIPVLFLLNLGLYLACLAIRLSLLPFNVIFPKVNTEMRCCVMSVVLTYVCVFM